MIRCFEGLGVMVKGEYIGIVLVVGLLFWVYGFLDLNGIEMKRKLEDLSLGG